MELKDALIKLDPMEDAHWTQDGSPRIDVVSGFLGSPVTRQQIIDAAPLFSRANSILEKKEPEPNVEEEKAQEVDVFEDFLVGEIMEEREFVQFLNTVSADHLEELESMIVEQNDQAAKAATRAQDLVALTKRQLSFVRSRIKAERPDVSNQEAIRLYLAKQHEIRAEKANLAIEIKKTVDIRKLDPRAVIDRAMARKTARGMSRPVRPVK